MIPEKIWEIISSIGNIKKGKTYSPSQIINDQLEVVTEPPAMTEIFKDHFVEIGPKLSKAAALLDQKSAVLSPFAPPISSLCSMFFSPLAPEEVTSIICQLKGNKEIRSNDIATEFFKLGSTSLAFV